MGFKNELLDELKERAFQPISESQIEEMKKEDKKKVKKKAKKKLKAG